MCVLLGSHLWWNDGWRAGVCGHATPGLDCVDETEGAEWGSAFSEAEELRGPVCPHGGSQLSPHWVRTPDPFLKIRTAAPRV